jgi:hypothetical protein
MKSEHNIQNVRENRKRSLANCGLYGFGDRSRQLMKLMTGLNDCVVADASVAVDNSNNAA